MKITLEYRNPTPSHCDIAVFINGGFAGELTLRQEEIVDFQMIFFNGTNKILDTIIAIENPNFKSE